MNTVTKHRPCTCDNVVKGQPYTQDSCRPCWIYWHSKARNLEWGGDGQVHPLPKLSREEMLAFRARRQQEIRLRPKPGTHLKRLFSWFSISDTKKGKGCGPCKTLAAEMDRKGIPWCRANMETILDGLEEEARARNIVFFRWVGKLFVERAIHNAEIESAYLLREKP